MPKCDDPRPAPQDLESWSRSDLDVMEDSHGVTIVKGLTLVEVKSAAEVLGVLREGYALRTTASTMQVRGEAAGRDVRGAGGALK